MEELISIFIKKFPNYFLGDVEILKDLNLVLQWTTLQEIKTSIMNYRKLINDDIVHLYYSRYLQTLFAEKSPIPEACKHGVTLLIDLKHCIKDINLENSINLLKRQIGSSFKESTTLESISMLINEIKRMKTEFNVGSFIDIENDIYLGLKSWIVEKKQDFDIWKLRECYNNIDRILTNDTIKQEINDLVAVKVYNWFMKTYSSLIQDNLSENILTALDIDSRRIYNWITSIDCRPEINIKIENFEPLIGKTDLYEKDPNNNYRITEKNQLTRAGTDNDYIQSIKKNSYHLAVYKAIIRETGEMVVVKSFTSDKRESLQSGLNEKEIYEKLLKIEKDFMLKYYGSFVSTKKKNSEAQYKLNIVLEYCDYTLNEEMLKLYKEKKTYTSQEIAQNVYTLIDLYKKLRDAKVNHCDIKPQNIFIASGRRFKIGDFDLSEAFSTHQASNYGTNFHEFQGGTASFMAPEVKELYIEWKTNNSSDKKKMSKERSDIYSLGLVFLMMITLRPIGGLNDQARQGELSQMIEELKLGWQKRLLRKMLANNYQNRPRFNQALEILEEDPEFILCLNSSS